jgi:pimeloyl-ACP methyl ester carboxylesterase
MISMTASKRAEPEFRYISANGIRLRAALLGTGPLVVLVHGFPESWYSWRHQLAPIAEAGFTACAIDVRGYGGSDRPERISDYGLEHIIGDVAAVIQVLSPDDPAVVVGHDWGAAIAWNTAIVRPDRVRAVAGLSVAYPGKQHVSFRDIFTEYFTDKGVFFYQAYLQAEGVAEAEIEQDPKDFLRRFYFALSGDAPDGAWPADKKVGDTLLHRLPRPSQLPAWLTEADIDHYAAEFQQSGFRGPLNRYRNHDEDVLFLSRFSGEIDQPSLYIGGDRDMVLTMLPGFDPIATMKAHLSDLRGADLLPGCGHWTQQERPQEVNARLIPWLKSL